MSSGRDPDSAVSEAIRETSHRDRSAIALSVAGMKAEAERLLMASGVSAGWRSLNDFGAQRSPLQSRLGTAVEQGLYLRWKTRVIGVWSGLTTLTTMAPSAARE